MPKTLTINDQIAKTNLRVSLRTASYKLGSLAPLHQWLKHWRPS
jgi:hypothetical protein